MTNKSRQGLSKGVAKASGVVGAFTLLSRILGLLRDAVIAAHFTVETQTDAFFVAFKIPNLLRRLVAEGALSTAFIPVLTDELNKGKTEAHKAIKSVSTFCLALTCILSALGIIFAEQITLFFAPGFASNPEKLGLSIKLLKLMFPYITLVSLLALSSSILNTLHYFALPALAPAILNIVMIFTVLCCSTLFSEPVTSLAWAVLCGGVLSLMPQLIQLKKLGFPIAFSSPFKSTAVRNLLKLMIPAVLSASVYQLMVFVNTLLASLLDAGSVTWLYYADRVFQFPLGVFSLAVATALLPSFSRHSSNGDNKSLEHDLLKALELITVITLPATVGLFLLAEPIISIIYQRGYFSAYHTQQTAQALMAYSLGLWAISSQGILVRLFIAKKNTVLPAKLSIVTLLINTGFALLLMGQPVQQTTTTFGSAIVYLQNFLGGLFFSKPLISGHIGLALAGTLSSYFTLMLLLLSLREIDIHLNLKALALVICKCAGGSALMGILIIALKQWDLNPWVLVGISVPLSVLFYFSLAHLLKIDVVHLFLNQVRNKLSSKS